MTRSIHRFVLEGPIPRAAFWIGPGILFFVFLLFPLATIFHAGYLAPAGGYGWNQIQPVLWFTVWQAALSTVLTLFLGVPAAYLFGRRIFPGKRLFRVLTFIPFILPTMVAAAGMEAWLGPGGWMNWMLAQFGWHGTIPFQHTLGAILFANVFYNTAIIIRVVGATMEKLDPRLEEAARMLGADRLQVFFRVLLPLIVPSLVAASLLVFFFDFSSFGVILILGGPAFATLEVEIFLRAVQLLDLRAAALLAGVQMACTIALSVVTSWLSARSESGLGGRRVVGRPLPLRTMGEKLWAGGILTVLSLILITPMVAPIFRSILVLDNGHWSVSAQYYLELWTNRRGSAFYVPPMAALGNSILVGMAATAISLGMAVPAAIALSRPTRLEKLVEPLWLLPLGTSAVVIGLGFLLAFGRFWPALAVSPVLLPIAHSLVAFPFVLRSLRPAFAAIPRRLHEAAATLGASRWQTVLRVDIPLAMRAVTSAAAFAFAISLGEFGATVLITRPDFPTLPVAIYRFLSQPGGMNYGQAMAAATMLLGLCGLSVALIDRGGETNA
jgi:thiamine transport system permease protein